jgi:hypothetical protein
MHHHARPTIRQNYTINHTTHIFPLNQRPSKWLSSRVSWKGCSVDRSLNTKSELDANVNVTGHLDNLGELDGLLGCGL